MDLDTISYKMKETAQKQIISENSIKNSYAKHEISIIFNFNILRGKVRMNGFFPSYSKDRSTIGFYLKI